MNIDIQNQTSLENLKSQLQGVGMNMPLSKFVEMNLDVFKEFKKYHVPLKSQAEITSQSINKNVSVSSLAVSLSRLNSPSSKSSDVIIMEKFIKERFVSKDAILVLGNQKEIVKETATKNGITKTEEKEKLIDWRGLSLNESVSSWVNEYKNQLIAINLTGWRWGQIADAINEHLNLKKKITKNTLTSIICIANKKDKSNK